MNPILYTSNKNTYTPGEVSSSRFHDSFPQAEVKFRSPAETLSMDNLPLGESAVIDRLQLSGRQRQHMEDLGFVPGASIKALHSSPAGDPIAYSVMGAVIALRREDAAHILCSGCTNNVCSENACCSGTCPGFSHCVSNRDERRNEE